LWDGETRGVTKKYSVRKETIYEDEYSKLMTDRGRMLAMRAPKSHKVSVDPCVKNVLI